MAAGAAAAPVVPQILAGRPAQAAQPADQGPSMEMVEGFKAIAQMAVRIIFAVGTVFMAAAVLPIAFQAVFLPLSAVGSAFLAGFFFQPDSFYCPPTREPRQALLRPLADVVVNVQAAGPQAPLPADAPRGIVNNGNNCWLNADLQLYECDPFIRQWARQAPPPLPAPLVRPADIEDRQRFEASHLHFQQFFAGYDQAVAQNRAVGAGSSQAVRRAISQMNAMIEAPGNPLMNRQEDAHEGIALHLAHLPDAQKIHLHARFHYNTDGLPAIEGHPDGIRVIDERDWGMELAIHGRAPQVDQLLDAHCDEIVADPTNTVSLRGVDGEMHRYPVARIERRFVAAPPMLRLTLKRFYYQKAPDSWLTKIGFLARLFPQLMGRTVRNNDVIRIPLEKTITLEDGTVQNYRLKGFNCHHGSSPNGGHYTAYTRRGDQWYWADDTFVIPVDQRRVERTLASRDPYMVWYERV